MGFSDTQTNHAYIRVTDMKNRTVNTSDLKYISDDVYQRISQYTISKSDLYVTIAGTIGVAGEVPDSMDGMNLTENAVKICNISVDKTFLCFCLLSDFVQDQFQDKTHQVAMPKLALERILGTMVPVAPILEQNRIVIALKAAFGYVDTIENERDDLAEIIKKVKASILDHAIRGKLVPQNPDDEPASVLLERIRTEKEDLIKQGKVKRDKRESVIFRGEDNSYYLRTGDLIESLSDWEFDDLPESWAICCLGEVCDYGNCINVETADISDTEWILDLEDIEKETGRILTWVKKGDRASASTKHQFHKGQVLYSKLRPYLNKVVLADQDGYCTSEILPLEFSSIVLPEYARYYLMSPTFLRYANHCSYGVKMPRLGTEDGRRAILPIPPLKEQEQIVKKIQQAFFSLDSIAMGLQ